MISSIYQIDFIDAASDAISYAGKCVWTRAESAF